MSSSISIVRHGNPPSLRAGSIFKKGRDLYSNIVVVDEFGGTRATDALQKALWGTKWLDIIGDSLKAAQPVIEQAREETNRRLLEVNP